MASGLCMLANAHAIEAAYGDFLFCTMRQRRRAPRSHLWTVLCMTLYRFAYRNEPEAPPGPIVY